MIELVKTQVTERNSLGTVNSQGLEKWCDEIDICFTGFVGSSRRGSIFLLNDIGEDMLEQLAIIEYCLETLQELTVKDEE